MTLGDHVIKTYSRQQKVVALSGAEAELYAMVAASAENPAVAAYAKDLGETLGGEVFTDSSGHWASQRDAASERSDTYGRRVCGSKKPTSQDA